MIILNLEAISFSKLLQSIKSGENLEDIPASQFDERTEEGSAEQYFQVNQLDYRLFYL